MLAFLFVSTKPAAETMKTPLRFARWGRTGARKSIEVDVALTDQYDGGSCTRQAAWAAS